MNLIERNLKSEEKTDVTGVVFRLIIFAGLLFAISFLLEGCTIDPSMVDTSDLNTISNITAVTNRVF